MPVDTHHPQFPQPESADVSIWRYMDFTKFVWMLERGAIYFPQASRLGDPFEGSFTAANIRERPDFYGRYGFGAADLEAFAVRFEEAPHHTYVSSWHLNEGESAAMWRLYLKSDEGLAVRSTYARLRDALDATERPIFLGVVSYIDYEINLIAEGNTFAPFMHKRKSYEHEREVRAIIRDDLYGERIHLGAASIEEQPGVEVEIALPTVVEAVHVAPGSPGWIRDLVEAVARRYGLDAPVLQSAMDAGPLW